MCKTDNSIQGGVDSVVGVVETYRDSMCKSDNNIEKRELMLWPQN